MKTEYHVFVTNDAYGYDFTIKHSDLALAVTDAKYYNSFCTIKLTMVEYTDPVVTELSDWWYR